MKKNFRLDSRVPEVLAMRANIKHVFFLQMHRFYIFWLFVWYNLSLDYSYRPKFLRACLSKLSPLFRPMSYVVEYWLLVNIVLHSSFLTLMSGHHRQKNPT